MENQAPRVSESKGGRCSKWRKCCSIPSAAQFHNEHETRSLNLAIRGSPMTWEARINGPREMPEC